MVAEGASTCQGLPLQTESHFLLFLLWCPVPQNQKFSDGHSHFYIWR